MASRAPGRRRAPGHWRPAGRPSLLILDYLETGLFHGRPDAASPPGRQRTRVGQAPAPAPSPWPPDRTASGVRRLLADGRVLAVAAVVAVALAVLAGTSVPLHSTQAASARPRATPATVPQSPGTPAAPSPARPAATPSASPPARPAATPSASPPARATVSPGAAGSNGAAPRQA